jgi:hypothetical protein
MNIFGKVKFNFYKSCKNIFLSIFIIILVFPFSPSIAQTSEENYIPLNIQKAYKKGTRSLHGIAGKNYWSNHSKYFINVKFNPYTKILEGSESIIYYNESPDTLTKLVFRLYQDFFKIGNSRDWQIAPQDIHNGIKIKKILINKIPQILHGKGSTIYRKGTNLFLKLNKPLLSEDSISIQFNWNVPITSVKSGQRMGQFDSTSFFIGYWYPQMAVYDDIDGWDIANYTGNQEFYNDFSDYFVEISVPKNFVVWATGLLQNTAEVLNPKYYKRYTKALATNKVVNIITVDDIAERKITKNKEWNIFKFTAKHVPDFAFSVSDHFLWDLVNLNISQKKKRNVLIGAAYSKDSDNFFEITEFSKRAIEYFSKEMPAVLFPYPSFTLFNGGSSMEFPMMTNEKNIPTWSVMSLVTSHEISHTYFPFLMGINERKYAWMDEGWATVLNLDFRKREVPYLDPVEGIMEMYLKVAGSEFDIPPMVLTTMLGAGSRVSYDAYDNSSYYRPGVAYYLLEQMVGRKNFLKALKEYIKRWRGKHPIPNDFFFTFNNVLKEDLGWFWKPWFYNFAYADLKLSISNKDKNFLSIEILNKGKLPVPVYLTIHYTDGRKKIIKKPMRIWKGNDKIKLNLKTTKDIQKIELGNNHIPDVKPSDNIIFINKF